MWVGWVTSNFHRHDATFDPDAVHTVTVTLGDDSGKVQERSLCAANVLPQRVNTSSSLALDSLFSALCLSGIFITFFRSVKRCVCYMVCAGEATGLAQSRRSSGLEIGCLMDTATGLLTFTSNGVEMSTFFQVGHPGNDLMSNTTVLFFHFQLFIQSLKMNRHIPASLFPFSPSCLRNTNVTLHIYTQMCV